ncbi:PadR family transcriptional regulator [archaeon]|nr:PadR family transcriptional regulator [archaeon]
MALSDVKGFLSYLLLWMLSKKSMAGAEIARELEKRRGSRPSPGTIYPALKELKLKGFIEADRKKVYSLTKKGRLELNKTCSLFCRIFYDMHEMLGCCKVKEWKDKALNK